METRYRHSTVSTHLSALIVLIFICHGVSFAQTKGASYGEKTALIISKIDAAAVKEFQEAWRASHNGLFRFEALVLVYSTNDGLISVRSQGKCTEKNRCTFGWTDRIIAVVHTHPNGDDPKPSGGDSRLADRFHVPVFTLTERGMFVYDPETRKISMVQDGLDWLESSKMESSRAPGK